MIANKTCLTINERNNYEMKCDTIFKKIAFNFIMKCVWPGWPGLVVRDRPWS